jgi:spoIIIJ-associated protein
MAELEIEGKTVEEAIKTGLDKLGVSKDKAKIKILNEGSSGLFGLMGSKPAKVLIIAEGIEIKDDIDYELAKSKTKTTVLEILKLMGLGVETVEVSAGEGAVSCAIKSPDGSFIIGKNGQALEALEHIVNLIVNRSSETRVKVNLDTEDYRLRQEQRIKATAVKAAEQVAASGKSYRLDPMSARDRRIVHIALRDISGVETFSEGEGAFRKVIIKPSDGK